MFSKVLAQCAAAIGVAMLSALPAQAQFPERPIKLVIPFTAGGPTDALGRALAGAMQSRIGQPVVVENKAGAGGNIAADFVSNAAPDGYTLMLGTSGPLVINVSLYKKLAYDPIKSFDPIIMIGALPNVIVAHPSFPAKTIAELVAYSKAHKGALSFSHAGVGGSTHLAGVMFNQQTGTDLVQVAYRGASQAMQDLIGGQVQLSILDVYLAAPQVKAGTMKALGVTAGRRTPIMPDVPTLDEQGIKGFDSSVIFGIVAPKGTPADIVAKLNATLAAVLDDPATKMLLDNQGIVRAPSTDAAYLSQYMSTEIPKWRDVIKSVGIEQQ
ncbi:tripartite tricarboxylate transporter family receptor [Variibacter gotjawalensis]|uniref:Tripartite tricarboxylate transporter family receptor n=1 Tax=Variibacter gotjawalensis TaxID=1333996 RepID=A0A0S3Q173_9BRAD|nr:tripartite tricarboxylate transporter substrate binding protein [Variibacter gotjawalensis]NIK47749.1 tripartite-type tricarboxylate transporter receptor subunit TctC [Variibacter gotjawalensis]RZS49638.1 tripartite-type tricarboxylate transporter receptor subunit TctC [Variibacter gotjawalensis]BAT61902.1 tripartite tricarboxylate transporter family receptor [Variibacter gotjawalensis]